MEIGGNKEKPGGNKEEIWKKIEIIKNRYIQAYKN
jgi:hypothetical protein